MRTRNLVIFVISLLFCLFIFSACSIDEWEGGEKGIGNHGGGTPPNYSESESNETKFKIEQDSTFVK